MKESKLVSVILIAIISFIVLFSAKNVLAATDFTESLNSSTTSTSNSTSTKTDNNTTVISSSKGNTTNNNTVLKTNNTKSTYNNTSLPKTGVEDSMPAVVLVVVLGISAVYAYKKMQDYKNI